MIANCYFVHENGRIQHQQKEIHLHFEGNIPQTIMVSYDAALLDENVRAKFDPRASWDTWTSGADPFARKVDVQLTAAFGLTYLDSVLHNRFLKQYPHLREPKEEVFFKGTLKESYWSEGGLFSAAAWMSRGPKPKAPDTFFIPRKKS